MNEEVKNSNAAISKCIKRMNWIKPEGRLLVGWQTPSTSLPR